MASGRTRTVRASVWLSDRRAPKRRTEPSGHPGQSGHSGQPGHSGPGGAAGAGAETGAGTETGAGAAAAAGTGIGTGSGAAAEQPAGLDLDRIVAATVRLLDAEGLAKFSMRRLAAELGVTAMSVYWYVDTKDDLLEYAVDAAGAELELPEVDDEADEADEADEDTAADWRDQLRQLAATNRAMLVRHPWVSRLIGEYLNIGPNSMAFATAAQRVVIRSGLPMEQIPGALALVYQFVYGFGTIESRYAANCREAGLTEDEYFDAVMATVDGRPEFEESQRLMEARPSTDVASMRAHDFEVALDCAIAGIEVLRDRARRDDGARRENAER
ncbi:TetR/AcrR family transcriptional regulator [Streptomyces varsoviensis]|uniref:TetR/AcrR family transcriptional regulator n=1 Tax=Streptomyces varsoviensis TaxID=67373 RepID=UPI0033EDB0A5